jgi:glycosyltransferase involved in cell wall biosynthesis
MSGETCGMVLPRCSGGPGVRVVMVEPQGQGGICHYAYSLCAALSESQRADVTLATGDPYELADAPQSFPVVTPFGPGVERRAIQRLLRRPDLRHQAQPALGAATPAPTRTQTGAPATTPFQAKSAAGRASRWLAMREADRGWRRVLDLVRDQSPAVAHIQWFMNPERDRQWVDMLRARNVPVVLTAHNILPHDAPPETRATWASLYHAADALIVHYQRALDELETLGIDLSKVSLIPHGNYCAIRALTLGSGDMETRRAAARQHLGLSPAAPVVLCFGLMRPYKGIQYLLPAFAAVRQELPEARLILAGRAPDGFTAIQAEIARLGLEDATLSFPTYLPLHEAATVFEACDLVALPYVEASQSGVVQLAYANSRPVVATRVGGIPEAALEGETGALVAPRESDELAQTLLSLLRDREQCAQLGARARQFAEEQFAWGPIAERTAQVYECVGGARSATVTVAQPGARPGKSVE